MMISLFRGCQKYCVSTPHSPHFKRKKIDGGESLFKSYFSARTWLISIFKYRWSFHRTYPRSFMSISSCGTQRKIIPSHHGIRYLHQFHIPLEKAERFMTGKRVSLLKNTTTSAFPFFIQTVTFRVLWWTTIPRLIWWLRKNLVMVHAAFFAETSNHLGETSCSNLVAGILSPTYATEDWLTGGIFTIKDPYSVDTDF